MSQVGRLGKRGTMEIKANLAAFLDACAATRRQQEIDALPTMTWKGRTLYTIRCCGVSGKGQHAVNVPELLLWSLIDLRRYFCPYHAADAMLTQCAPDADRLPARGHTDVPPDDAHARR